MERVTITDFEFQGKHPYISAFTIQDKVQIHVDLTPMKIHNPEIYNFYWVEGSLHWWANGAKVKTRKPKRWQMLWEAI